MIYRKRMLYSPGKKPYTGKSYPNPETGRGSSIGSEFAWHVSGPEFDPHVRHILSSRLGHENISTAIFPPPLIQEEQLSVSYWRKNVH